MGSWHPELALILSYIAPAYANHRKILQKAINVIFKTHNGN